MRGHWTASSPSHLVASLIGNKVESVIDEKSLQQGSSQILDNRHAEYFADGKTKANELSLPLCQEERWAFPKVVNGHYWLVSMLFFCTACPVPPSASDNFSVVGSLRGWRVLF